MECQHFDAKCYERKKTNAEGFNQGLSYMTDQVIVMGLPSEKLKLSEWIGFLKRGTWETLKFISLVQYISFLLVYSNVM